MLSAHVGMITLLVCEVPDISCQVAWHKIEQQALVSPRKPKAWTLNPKSPKFNLTGGHLVPRFHQLLVLAPLGDDVIQQLNDVIQDLCGVTHAAPVRCSFPILWGFF